MVKVQTRFILLIACSFLALSCQTIKGWMKGGSTEDAQPSREEAIENVRPATNAELEKRLASVTAKVSDLEQQTIRNKARIKILERGLLLGVIPDELKNPDDLKFEKEAQQKTKPTAQNEEKADAHAAAGKSKPEEEATTEKHPPVVTEAPVASESRDYQTLLTAAQNHFQEGKYGQAIAEFSSLGKNFPAETKNGNHKFWIALSWANMREYESAQKQFSEFIRDHGDNTWVPRAKFHLAKSEYKLGYREKALESMRAIIKDYPNEDASEMAKAEIASLEKSL